MYVREPGNMLLLSDAQLLNKFPVSRRVYALDVVKQTPPLVDDFKQSLAGVMVFGVFFKMVGKVVDPFSQQRDLHLG
jgi:hypothetical protein